MTTGAADAPDGWRTEPTVAIPAQRPPAMTIITVAYENPREVAGLGIWLTASGLLASGQAEWIVVNNGASETDLATAPRKAVVLLDHRTNVGYGKAVNLAREHATGQVIVVLNSDVALTVEDLSALVGAVRSDPGAIWAPSLKTGSTTVFGRKFYSAKSLLTARVPGGRRHLEVYTPGEQVDWVLGACVALDRTLFDRLGGFDDRYFLYFEDVDLCWRAWEAGARVRVLTTVTVLHGHRRASSRKLRPFLAHVRSALVFFRAHPEALRGEPPRRPREPDIPAPSTGLDVVDLREDPKSTGVPTLSTKQRTLS